MIRFKQNAVMDSRFGLAKRLGKTRIPQYSSQKSSALGHRFSAEQVPVGVYYDFCRQNSDDNDRRDY